MGAGRDSRSQSGGHILIFWKIKAYTFSKISSFCSLKLPVIILFKGISCYHLPEAVIEEKV